MEPYLRSALRLAPTLALGMTGLFGGSSLVWGAGVSELVQRYGLSPVEPPRPAADFELPLLGGSSRSLSDFAGNWTVLTFWASWCGPCRAEMPSLEATHQRFSNKGVAVLGVTVDPTEAAAEAFVEAYGLTFPQLWDQDGAVGARYNASAIPLSYLVDPGGRIVALARGARDWTELAGLLEGLTGTEPDAETGKGVYADAPDPAAVAHPPAAKVVLSDSHPGVGKPFSVDVRLEWSGSTEAYLPGPPRVALPDGVIEQGITASSSSREGDRVLVYHIALVAERAGEFALDPIELQYQASTAQGLASSLIAGPTVVVEPRTVLGLSPRGLVAVVGAAVVVGVSSLLLLRRRTAGRAPEVASSADRFVDLSTRYDAARQLRVQGDGPAFALAMTDLLDELDSPDAEVSESRRQQREGWRFGGRRPSAAEMDQLQRQVSRRIESLRPDPTAEARRALQLQDDEEMA